MLRTTCIALAAGLLLAAPAAASGPPKRRCLPHHGEHLVAHSSRAALIAIGDSVLWGCSLADGHRRRLNPPGLGDFQDFRSAQLVGTRAAFVDDGSDHYSQGVEQLILDSATSSGHRLVVAEAITFYEPPRLRSVRIGADGTVAWINAYGGALRLWLWRLGDVARSVDEGFALSAVALAPGRLSWMHGGARRSVETRPSDRCPAAGRFDATEELDLFERSPGAVACWRATGATTALPDVRPQDVVASGPWVAASTSEHAIVVADVLTGAARTVAVPERVRLVIDGAGSVAWVQSDPVLAASGFSIWADDAGGTRQLGAGRDMLNALTHDGPTVHWSAGLPGQSSSATLSDA